MSALGVSTGCVASVLHTRCILDLVATAQRSDARSPLLIRGEPGVGKDVLARLIHAVSDRQPYSFIKVNCRGQALDGCKVELFGCEGGSVPLARRRHGSIEYANHGTIYLDEIGDLPRGLIPALVQVLRTGEFSPAGRRETSRVDVRVIASTVRNPNRGGPDDLWQKLRRLNAVEIQLPPLRERTDEIPLFASFFAEQFSRQYRREVHFSPGMLAAFEGHSWPGNVRELEESVRRIVGGGNRSILPPPEPVVASSHRRA